MKLWQQITVLAVATAIVVLILGPIVGAVELGIIFALFVLATVLLVRRSRKREAVAGP